MDCNLYELISKKSQIVTEEKAKSLFWQICKAMEFFHGKGIFHRDIKPEVRVFVSLLNIACRIFLSRKDSLKLEILAHAGGYTQSSPLPSISLPGGIGRRNVFYAMACIISKWIFGEPAVCSLKWCRGHPCSLAPMNWISYTVSTTLWEPRVKKFSVTCWGTDLHL